MNPRIYLATRKGLFTVKRSHGNWSVTDAAFLGTHVPMLLPDRRDGSLYAVAELGHFGSKLHKRARDSLEWREIGAPAYPRQPEEVADVVDPIRGQPIPWSLEKIWCLEAGGDDEPGRLWAGTLPGGLFSTNDGGDSWELVRNLWDRPERVAWFGGGYDYPGIHSICVHPQDARHLLVAVSCGGVWRTRDGGNSWELTGKGMIAPYAPPEAADDPNIQDPHRMVQSRTRPEVLWIQHHSAIYRSSDTACSWQAVTSAIPSEFGFAVAVHPADHDTAWFVPAVKDEVRVPVDGRFVVSRTRDGGHSYEVLSKGLPAQPAYHLVYRHGLDVDPSGHLLAMGSTTGGVWVTEDGGESWQEISQHLPPVYCVRFG